MNSQVIIELNTKDTIHKVAKQRHSGGVKRRALLTLMAYVIHLTQYARLFLFRSRSRRQLAKLPEYRLQDIGLSKEQAMKESAKWFWQK